MDRSWLSAAEEALLLVPGPTPVPGRVLRAQARAMMNHRAPAFRKLLRAVTDGLQWCFGTASDPLILTASGTGGLEAALVNTLSPGDRVLAVISGAFGQRFADIAAAYGAVVDRLEVPWGQAADVAAVAERLDGSQQAVLCTLNETSTGVVNPVQQIAALCRERGPLCLVDAISGLMATPLEVDAWGVDVAVAGSQKAFMIPPGLCFVTMSDRAWQAQRTATMPRFYFDLAAAAKTLAKGENPWTPAVSLVYALFDALEVIEDEGPAAMLARHARLRDGVRAGLRSLGLRLLAADDVASPAVTAVFPPDGLPADELRKHLRERYRCELAGGQGPLKGALMRVGHLGYVQEPAILQGVALLAQALADHGRPVDAAAALQAAREAMSG
ncbi:MAG: alanine--glyoxylate aminotransferase family protein [Fimbriimonadaceae bacterium]|nr:alanine--glyoxylate aminotransferase family protein [Fimbriimonadaceae bacterium]